MKVKILLFPFLLLSVLALADQPLDLKSVQIYRQELLEVRRGMEGLGYTPNGILEARLAGLHSIPSKKVDLTYLSLFDEDSGSNRSVKLSGYIDIFDKVVNEDDFASTFDQKNPSVCIFPDRSFVTVWEDERNGDLDIYAQKYAFDGAMQGVNFEAAEEGFPKDQYLPRVSLLSDTSFVVVWVDEESFVIYGRIYDDNLAPLGSSFQISDSPLDYSTWAPAVSSGHNGEFVVVWEDTRSGSNIYLRRFDSSGSPLGSSLKVNDDAGERLHLSPDVSVDTSGIFVVVWEDFRNLDADIFAQRFDSDGAMLGSNVLVNVDSLSEDQYTPSVAMGWNGRFAVSWVDLRREDAFIFARSLSFGSPTGDTHLFTVGSQVGTVVQESPQIASDTLDRFIVSWTEYTPLSLTVYAQRFDSLGQSAGDTLSISDLHSTGERHGLTLSTNPGGSFVAAWMDNITGNYDILARTVAAEGVPQNSIVVVNHDLVGANQSRPKIATCSDGGFVAVWEDMRRNSPDIFMKLFDQDALALGADFIVNDSSARVYRGNPDVSTDPDGNFVVVWEDARENALDIYAQMFDNSGTPDGGNIKVNCEGMLTNSTPSCEMSTNGDFVVVWSSLNGSIRDIYGRLFSSVGLPLDTCFLINDDLASVNHLSPVVSMDSTGRFVVAWQDGRDGSDRIYLQRFTSDGSKVGGNFPAYTDDPDPLQYDPDLDVNQEGDFVVAWTEPYGYSTMIYAQRYDSSGSPIDTNIMLADDVPGSPEEPKVKLTDDGYLAAVWTNNGDEGTDIYYRMFLEGESKGASSHLNAQADSALQDLPDIDLLDSHLYAVWRDNRTPGLGFSIYFNRTNYTGSGVEDEEEEVSIRPVDFKLYQNFPNPFNPTTTIKYFINHTLARTSYGSMANVTVEVYNVLGQKVRTLVEGQKQAGNHETIWDGRGDDGSEFPSGVYFCRLRIQDQTATMKMLLLK